MDEIGINVDVDIHNARHALKEYAPDLEKQLKATFKEYAKKGADYERANVRVRTGNLKASIGSSTSFTKNQTRLRVTSTGARGVSRYRWPQNTGRHTNGSGMTGTQYVNKAANRLIPEAVDGILRTMDRIGHEFEQRANGG
jgi:hypothetical protein